MSSSVASGPSTPQDRPIAVGTVIHGYQVRRTLSARPGMDVVVEAKAPDGRLVALTVFPPELTRDKELRRRLLRLAMLRASIAHPHVLPVLGVLEQRNRIVLVSLIPSPWTLADRLRLGALEPDEALRILAQVASGLEAAAGKGLVHHDLSAGSIVMDEGEPANAVLTDFGISLPPTPGCELLSATESLDYRSPEQVRGEAPQPASNVYSLSCILVACLTGTPPFPYDRPLLTLHAHVVEPAPQISRRREELTPDIDRVLAKGMAKDPRERFASPTQLIRTAAPALGVKTRVWRFRSARDPGRRAACGARAADPVRGGRGTKHERSRPASGDSSAATATGATSAKSGGGGAGAGRGLRRRSRVASVARTRPYGSGLVEVSARGPARVSRACRRCTERKSQGMEVLAATGASARGGGRAGAGRAAFALRRARAALGDRGRSVTVVTPAGLAVRFTARTPIAKRGVHAQMWRAVRKWTLRGPSKWPMWAGRA
jgi:hypothetical protein